MKVDVFDLEGKKLRQVELSAKVFEAPVNVDLMHQAYVRQMANSRLGTHDTKVRSEVSGGGRKPWKQKPRQMFTGIRENITPTIAAVATLLIVFTTALLGVLEWLRGRRR